jgi:oligopeptide/dipeptide ABC transporter ATP-binding protein
VLTVGEQVAEVFTAHGACGNEEAGGKAVSWLRKVGMPDPERRVREYPHQLSGGMRQRTMIAMALALEPSLLIADEPTTALDVTIEAQILDLLRELRRIEGMAVLLITHDLGVVHEFADRTAIMYLGRIVEIGRTADLFADPVHPYTQGLLESLPGKTAGGRRLSSIPGTVPGLTDIPPGCPFAERCKFRQTALSLWREGRAPADVLAVCDRVDPPLEEYGPGHFAACHYQKSARKGNAA